MEILLMIRRFEASLWSSEAFCQVLVWYFVKTEQSCGHYLALIHYWELLLPDTKWNDFLAVHWNYLQKRWTSIECSLKSPHHAVMHTTYFLIYLQDHSSEFKSDHSDREMRDNVQESQWSGGRYIMFLLHWLNERYQRLVLESNTLLV